MKLVFRTQQRFGVFLPRYGSSGCSTFAISVPLYTCYHLLALEPPLAGLRDHESLNPTRCLRDIATACDLASVDHVQRQAIRIFFYFFQLHVVALVKMRQTLPFFLLCLVTFANALHFYLDANQKRCFIEELPSDTVVEGVDSPG